MPSKAESENLAARWRPLIDAWHGSGQTQKAFCRANDLSYDQFVYWRRKFARGDVDAGPVRSSALVPVTYTSTAPGLSLLLPNGMELRGLTLDNVPVVQQLLARL
ncbi:MAG: hypothetical protein QNJ09_17895 [Paracoccaceae bacterium]|nr:hypothetical protein [Paracoccaceae bacterium]